MAARRQGPRETGINMTSQPALRPSDLIHWRTGLTRVEPNTAVYCMDVEAESVDLREINIINTCGWKRRLPLNSYTFHDPFLSLSLRCKKCTRIVGKPRRMKLQPGGTLGMKNNRSLHMLLNHIASIVRCTSASTVHSPQGRRRTILENDVLNRREKTKDEEALEMRWVSE